MCWSTLCFQAAVCILESSYHQAFLFFVYKRCFQNLFRSTAFVLQIKNTFINN